MNVFQTIAASNNLDDSRSLAQSAITARLRIGATERARLGITDGVIRVSIGLEDGEDLKDDFRQGVLALR